LKYKRLNRVRGKSHVKGHLITLEGGEGAGKTSVIPSLKTALEQKGYQVQITREPGGIQISEHIRDIILDPDNTTMDARTEVLLYAAARRQHLVEKVLPALEAGYIVLCDRFIDSSLAYQGYARGVGIDEVLNINAFAIQNCTPTLTLFFDIPPEEGLKRIALNKDRERNRLDLEAITFHEKVYEGYQLLTKQFSRIRTIDARQTLDQVASEAIANVMRHLENK